MYVRSLIVLQKCFDVLHGTTLWFLPNVIPHPQTITINSSCRLHEAYFVCSYLVLYEYQLSALNIPWTCVGVVDSYIMNMTTILFQRCKLIHPLSKACGSVGMWAMQVPTGLLMAPETVDWCKVAAHALLGSSHVSVYVVKIQAMFACSKHRLAVDENLPEDLCEQLCTHCIHGSRQNHMYMLGWGGGVGGRREGGVNVYNGIIVYVYTSIVCVCWCNCVLWLRRVSWFYGYGQTLHTLIPVRWPCVVRQFHILYFVCTHTHTHTHRPHRVLQWSVLCFRAL